MVLHLDWVWKFPYTKTWLKESYQSNFGVATSMLLSDSDGYQEGEENTKNRN